MTRRSALLLCVVASLSLGEACAPTAPSVEASLAGAKALDERFIAAFNAGDADALAALYSDSVTASIGPDGAISSSREEIRAGMAAVFASMPGARIELLDQRSAVVGTVVLSWGRSKVTVPTADGASQVLEGRFSDAKTLRGGVWQYVVDHASIPMPPAQPAPASAGASNPRE